jgi:hypothetical protein
VIDRLFFSLLSFLPVCGMHCSLLYTFCNSVSVYTLLSKLTWHCRTKCLPPGPCVQECMDSCCFVLELVGVCRASEKGTSSVRPYKVGLSYSWRGYYLQVCTAFPTVLFASVCCLPNCIICKCVLPVKLYYLQVCATRQTVLFASVCYLSNCIICKCVLPAQLYYLQVCATCPTALFANVCCVPNCIIYKCVLPACCLIPKGSNSVHPGKNIYKRLVPALGRMQILNLYLYLKISRHVEAKERLDEIYALNQTAHDLWPF